MSGLDPEPPWSDPDIKDPARVGRLLFDTVRDIERRQSGIHEGNKRHAQIYAGYTPVGFNSASGQISRPPHEATRAIIRSICDTATALISKFRPKPDFITDGAEWSVQRMAKDLDRFMVGAYEVGNVYPEMARAFHDSTIFGTGATKLCPYGKGLDFKVKCERILIDDLLVDEDECREGLDPVNMYHRVPVRADWLLKKYGKEPAAAEAIRAARGRGGVWLDTNYIPADKCVLIDAYHVDEDGNSRHVVAVDGYALVDEAWPYDFHPFVVLRWALPPSGFYGDGIAYRQYGRQQQISYLYRWVRRCHDLFATPRAWVDPAGGPPTMQLSNEIGSVIMSRRPPVFQTQQVVPPEVYRWLDGLERGGYDDEGISQASASNQLPVGIESAPAQREYSFKESNRFAPVSQRWETAVAVEMAQKMVAFYRAAGKGRTGARMAWADRKLFQTIDWGNVNLEQDAYQIRAAASSLESLSPSSRTQAAIELSQTGWVDKPEGRALLGHPDLDKADEIDSAPTRFAEKVAERLAHGEVVAVNEYANFAELDRVVRGTYLAMATAGAPDELLANFERYLEELTALQTPPVPSIAGPAGPPQPGMSAPAAAGAPVSLPGG